jgi:4-alpha-glucanotransferase
MKRKAGVLLPVTALTGDYGIGDFGAGADFFIDFILGAGFSVWQVLPITTIGAGNSPYSGTSTFAGNYLLIDINALGSELLTDDEKNQAKYTGHVYRVDYNYAKDTKKRLLQLAFGRVCAKLNEKITAFKKENAYWLGDYATFMVEKEGGCEGYYFFEQYIFFTQWLSLKERANARGVEIMGDLPIYVCLDSADVKANPKNFELDKNLLPKRVAGVPPDYFSEDGQLWGNPLYDYEEMEKDGYSWFVKRILHNLRLYDYLRIDHFRGLYSYWAVPAAAKTAKEGKWVKGPGLKIFDALKKHIKEPKIIAEDLGIIDDDIVSFVKKSGFAGMRVLQFAFDNDVANVHLPFNYDTNTVAYTATHDNNTTFGWIYNMNPHEREGVLNYLSVGGGWAVGGGKSPVVRAAVKEIIASSAFLAIVPLQDLAGYGADTRINIPGEPLGNWEFRATADLYYEVDNNYYLSLNRKYGRTLR